MNLVIFLFNHSIVLNSLHLKKEVFAKLDEEILFSLIYNDESLFKYLGREACTILDFSYNLGGTEAVVESYYSVMESQRQDGGQNNDTLDMRTFIDWCLPPLLAIPEQVIADAAKIYRNGDATALVKKHRTPITLAQNASKVINRIANSKSGLSHFCKTNAL